MADVISEILYNLKEMNNNRMSNIIRRIVENDPTLTSVEGIKFGDKELQILANALIKYGPNTHLRDLELQCCNISNAGAFAIADILQNTNLVELDLFDNQIGDVGFEQICIALRTNTTLKKLVMCSNDLTELGMGYICETLTVNTDLITLYLSDNNITDVGIGIIANMLSTNTTITCINLAVNDFTNVGLGELCEALKTNTTLICMYLQFNEIDDDGAILIAECLKVNTTLRSLDLRENHISDAGAIELNNALKINHTLTSLNMDDMETEIDDDILELIEESINRNKELFESQFWTPHLHLTEFPDSFHESLISSLLCNGSASGNIPTLPLNLWVHHIFPLVQIKSFY